MLIGLLGGAKQITVFDIDQRLIDFINEKSREYNLPIDAYCQDLTKGISDEFENKFDVFLTDPTPNGTCFKLFLSIGLKLLKKDKKGIGYVSYFPSHQKISLDFQVVLSDLSKVLTGIDKLKGRIKIMINVPVFQGYNDIEIKDFINYFNQFNIVPRFIESMPLELNAKKSDKIENILDRQNLNFQLKSSYLWGIKKYVTEFGQKFETLRCICYDNKCETCYQSNFIHIDQNFKIRPCNLRTYKITFNNSNIKESLIDAYQYLKSLTSIPEKYDIEWNK